jgi:NADH oxidase (H2O2-forming)
MPKRILIVGANAAGVEAASAARKNDRTAEIVLVTQESHAGYSRCGLPFVLGGHIPTFSDLIVYLPAYFKMMKLDLRTEVKAVSISVHDKAVSVLNKSGVLEVLPYDSLVIATGAYPFMPPIKGCEQKGVFSLRTLDDGEEINRAIEAGAKTALILGAGLIGLETGVALIERGLQVTVVEMLPQILPAMLDSDMALQVQTVLEEKGMRILTGKTVEELLGDQRVTGIIAGGEKINADIVISAFGVRANTKLAVEAGIPIGESRGIKTNVNMETEVKDIYAVGDCAETYNPITHRPVCMQLGTVAVKQGRVAGKNVAGGQAKFSGALGSAVTQLFETQIGVTGLTETAAKRVGVDVIIGTANSKTKAEYYPKALNIKIKLIVEKSSKRIVGAQIIGGEEVAQRVNAFSFAIQKQMTVEELTQADTAYAPPLSETWEPMIQAAEIVLRKLR